MAKRWSLNEDIIVCKYCIENLWAYSSDVDIEGIADKLEVAGFETRSKSAIRQRAYAYELLLERHRLSCIPEQVIMVYETVASENNHRLKEVKSYIREMYNPDAPAEILDEKDDLSELFGESNDLLGYKHTIEFQQTFPMVLQKYVKLKKIKKHKDMCDRIGMKPDTFSAILRGKYGEVKKDNILRICVGLELSSFQAEELLNSAGYTLSNAVMLDVVVKACLANRVYSPFHVNCELSDNGVPFLFHDYKMYNPLYDD